MPIVIIDHIKKCLGIFDADIKFHYEHDTTLYRHRDHICSYLKITRWKKNKTKSVGAAIHPGRHLATQFTYQAAQTMNYPADIINVVIEELIHHHHELPAFNQLNRLVKHTVRLSIERYFKTYLNNWISV